jgi:ATP-dependent DNA helicase RecG
MLGIERKALHAADHTAGEGDIVVHAMARAAAIPPSATLTLTTDIAEVPGVGRRAAVFRRLGIRCIADLILHLPQRYEHELAEQSVADAAESVGPLHKSTANVAVNGEIATARLIRSRRARFEATLQDATGTVLLTWFNSPWLHKKLHPGMTIRAWGKATRYGDYLQMVNPQWADLSGKSDDSTLSPAPREERLRPIYPASESLPSSEIEGLIGEVLEPALRQLDDHLHQSYRRERALPALADAYRMVHRPQSEDDIATGRRRLALDDLLLLQLAVFLKRKHRREKLRAPALKHGEAIDRHIRARLPFTLTSAQDAVLVDIVRDLKRTAPMNRLLQGDVGSGKTVVALYAMLMAVASNHQAALMAPTELLAEQHFASMTSMLAGAKVSIELLTGSMPPPARRAIHRRLQDGEIDILIGTHALLTKSVKFKSLALAVIDEQHRFGVHQRAHLRAKAADEHSSPHVLVMTATPIPRTLSITLYGDLDLSTIRELPPGRHPVITKVVARAKSEEVYRYVAQRLDAGDQAYIVVPVIDDTDSGLKDLRSHVRWLEEGLLRGRRLAAVHGRLKRDTREAIMHRFRNGEVQALVATTVIEVGVDVPNATIMIIEHADRFGLAQLHQLRGRVGRSSRKSLCVLIADPVTEDGKARIDAIASTNDGFIIAEKDLEIRGPGELFGSRQAGVAPFRVAQLPRDADLLRLARRDAQQWVEGDPHLANPRDALLRKRLLKLHGESFGLGDVA